MKETYKGWVITDKYSDPEAKETVYTAKTRGYPTVSDTDLSALKKAIDEHTKDNKHWYFK